MDQAQGLRNLLRPKAMQGGETGPAAPLQGPQRTTRLLAVTSGKGGVGKTNLSVNLALALAQEGYRTCLVDADLGLGNVEILLGLSPKYDLSHVVFGDRRLEEIVLSGPEGLRVIPAGSGWYELAQISEWRLNQLLSDLSALETQTDFMLIDTGAGLGRNVLQFTLAAREILLVTTPEPTAMTDAYSLLKLIHAGNRLAQVYLVVNMVDSERQGKSVALRMNQVARRFLNREMEPLGFIPRDGSVVASVRAQTPFLLASPRSAAARAVRAIAQRLLGGSAAPKPAGVAEVIRRMVGLFR